MTISRANIQGFSGISASNISDQDFDKLKNALSGSTETPAITPTTSAVEQEGGLRLHKDTRYDSTRKAFLVVVEKGGQRPQQASWDGGKTYHNYTSFTQEPDKTSEYFVKINNVPYKVQVITSGAHTNPVIVNFNVAGNETVVEETGTQPDVVNPATSQTPTEEASIPVTSQTPTVEVFIPQAGSYQKESAIVGQVYKSKEKVRVLCCSHGDHPDNYYYSIKKDGVLIYENFGKRPQMPSDRNADYMGDHPLETQLALEEGMYELFVQNFGSAPIIFGNITRDQYIQYSPGGLSWADWWVKLNSGETVKTNIYFDEKCNRDSLIIGGYSQKPCLSVNRPFYKDGIVYIEEMRIEGLPNGAEIKQEGSTILKFYSAIEPSRNISIEFLPSGVGGDVSFKVVEKNGLDVDPSTFMATCYNTSYSKFFCHDASQFKSADGKEL